MKNTEKKKLREEKLQELEKLFEDVSKEKKTLIQGLLEQSAFMYVQLKELNQIIEKNGSVEDFKQGKQQFTREQPALKSYNATMKSYNATIKLLSELLPPGKSIPKDDDFQEFKNRRKK